MEQCTAVLGAGEDFELRAQYFYTQQLFAILWCYRGGFGSILGNVGSLLHLLLLLF